MNLHDVASNVIAAVNPLVTATVQVSTGYTTNADGTQVPTYTTVTGPVQVQGLVEREYATLEHTDGFSMSAINRKMFAYGSINMAIRDGGTGGDIIQLPPNSCGYPVVTTWKLVRVWETWPDWCGVVIRQVLTPPLPS